jgi:hypothetical protein
MEQKSFQIVINDFETNPKVHIRYKDGIKFLGIHSYLVSEVVSKDFITQEESETMEAILQKLVDAERIDNPVDPDFKEFPNG